VNYREALAWLFGTQRFGIKLGLENTERLLGALELLSPEHRFIHVAGTNGKGSVCAMMDSILRAAGYRTGLFTSPHLVTFRERIQVSGEMISHEQVADGLTSIRDLINGWDPHPTFFEIATALGLQHFKRAACEVVVLETGMGGRLDATNAVTPVVSVITPIDFDHQKWLGHTLAEIAAEKAGIIKPGVPVVSAVQPPDAEAVIRNTAHTRKSPLHVVSKPYQAAAIALPGEHQNENASVAVAALHAAGLEVNDSAVERGLTNVHWPARFQRWDDRIIIDGAHNPAGARVLAKTWRETFAREQAAVILAVLRDKDIRGIIRALAPITSRFVASEARGECAVPANELAEAVAESAPGSTVTIRRSLGEALAETADAPRVLITGSLHFAGEALAHLRGEPAAFEECAQ
jgi:dihydrofolate synthase/folylpolyglutamate synthase